MNCIPDISKCLALCLVVLAIHCMPAKGDAIGFFYALESDLQGLKTLAHEAGPSTQIGSRSIQKLQLGTHAIYAIQMGAGAVETAASAQALLSHFRCDWALSLGPAGSLSDAAETGRWYRVGRVVAWQSGKSDQTWNTDWSRFPVAHPPELLQAAPSISLASGELFISTTSAEPKSATPPKGSRFQTAGAFYPGADAAFFECHQGKRKAGGRRLNHRFPWKDSIPA